MMYTPLEDATRVLICGLLMYAAGIVSGCVLDRELLRQDIVNGQKWIEFNSQGEASWVERKGK